jgi:hypothetical protein
MPKRREVVSSKVVSVTRPVSVSFIGKRAHGNGFLDACSRI